MIVRPRGSAEDRNREGALARALEATGIPCMVEARAGLALITCDVAHRTRLESSDARREVLALAKQHGFTHIALELAAPPGR